jgi:hypothetical protein
LGGFQFGSPDRARQKRQLVLQSFDLRREAWGLRHEQADTRHGGGFEHQADIDPWIALFDQLQRAAGDAGPLGEVQLGHAALVARQANLGAQQSQRILRQPGTGARWRRVLT